jgi:hypothetical protein
MLARFLHWLEMTPPAVLIRTSGWVFPTIETVHVLSLTLVVGSIAMVDLRLLNVALRDRDAAQLSREILPLTWCAFIVAAISGAALFSSAATKYCANPAVRIKFLLMSFAGLNMLIFSAFARRDIGTWGRARMTPRAAQIAGGLSLALWIGVVFAGRWIGFITP